MPRTYRRRAEPILPAPFKVRDYVAVEVPHHFKGKKLGVIIGLCKSGGIEVYLADSEIVTRKVCVDIERGDTITKITKS